MTETEPQNKLRHGIKENQERSNHLTYKKKKEKPNGCIFELETSSMNKQVQNFKYAFQKLKLRHSKISLETKGTELLYSIHNLV